MPYPWAARAAPLIAGVRHMRSSRRRGSRRVGAAEKSQAMGVGQSDRPPAASSARAAPHSGKKKPARSPVK
jgi:hypothetical protein